jgi:hypothetical protein
MCDICYRNAPFQDKLEMEMLDTGRLRDMARLFPVKVREMVGKLVGTEAVNKEL